jgi:hypothetical protein
LFGVIEPFRLMVSERFAEQRLRVDRTAAAGVPPCLRAARRSRRFIAAPPSD